VLLLNATSPTSFSGGEMALWKKGWSRTRGGKDGVGSEGIIGEELRAVVESDGGEGGRDGWFWKPEGGLKGGDFPLRTARRVMPPFDEDHDIYGLLSP